MSEEINENDLPETSDSEEVFTPCSKGTRIFAWVLFVVVVLGIITWLLNIACPGWIEATKAWLSGLFS